MSFISAILLSSFIYSINSISSSLIIEAEPDKPAKILYFGARLPENELLGFKSFDSKLPSAYPTHYAKCQMEDAINVILPDGNMTLDLRVKDVKESNDNDGQMIRICTSDTIYPFDVDICYLLRPGSEVFELWTEYANRMEKDVVLTRYDSAFLPVRRGDVWINYLYGDWANECNVASSPLQPGIFCIADKNGVANTQVFHPEAILSLDGQPKENEGRAIGMALCYTGNFELRFSTDFTDYHGVFAGINPDNSHYKLSPGEKFTTPRLALCYTEEGLGGVSRKFHKWGRKYQLHNGEKVRDILLNSWEGVYFDIKEKNIKEMISGVADLGGELFVLDDGWFGGKYQRNNDRSSLGDWVQDHRKLPKGLESLSSYASKHGVKFGIWVEPEMTNVQSELYEAHPDWIVKAPGREPIYGRGGGQMVLDLSNPEVRNYVVGVFDSLTEMVPGLDYIKWDANMAITSQGSQYLNEQSHFYIEYHRGLKDILDRIRAKHPQITIQSCASGGGRVNWGFLPYFDEFWASDNTDALQRINIQWGTSYFYPANAMACHVSASPNHRTHRDCSLKFRMDVAMSGRLGVEMQPKDMTEQELTQCKKAIEEYKQVRNTIQLGDLYRLVSPYDKKGLASLMYVNEDKTQAVFFWWRTESFYDQHLPVVPMRGLDPDKMYKIREIDRIDNKALSFEGAIISGRRLMDKGLDIPYVHNAPKEISQEWSSRVLVLECVE